VAAYHRHGQEKKCIQDFCGVTCRNGTIWKTQVYVGDKDKSILKEIEWHGLDTVLHIGGRLL
jgi:hypothetical protein